MKVAVLANGVWDIEWGRKELENVSYLVCADGGGNSALASGRLPDVLVGDLDSIRPENLQKCLSQGIQIKRYPSEKDETDLELALSYAIKYIGLKEFEDSKREIWLYGATGGRIDHLFGNIALMLGYAQKGVRIYLVDQEHIIWIIKGTELVKGSKGQEISLLPLSEKAVVSLEGFYYPLQEEVLYQTVPRGISNVLLDSDGTIKVHEGMILVVLLRENFK